MPTKTGKTVSSYYGNDLTIDQATNTGVDTATRKVQDGFGNNTSCSLSDDVLSVQPVNDNTTGTMIVKNSGGSNILSVDTTNSKVLTGASQVAANTQYAYFGSDSNEQVSYLANTHYFIPFSANALAVPQDHDLGTGTDPDTTKTISSTADNLVNGLWYLPDNITVDAVHWWSGADAGTGDTIRAHLMSYTIDTGNGSTGGDLSGGVVVADGADITNAGYEQAYYQSMTIQSADVDAGRIVLFTLRMDSVNSDYAINATVKYHIR